MGELDALLDLQRLDSRADRLKAQRAGLPERAARLECERELLALAERRAGAEAQRAELAREERRFEGEVADVRGKAQEVERTLYSGTVTVPRELEALQLEVDSFKRRQGALEDEELALLEQIEGADAGLAELDARKQEIESRAQELGATIAAAEGEIDRELESIDRARDGAAAHVPERHLAAYEKRRAVARLGGVAVARLEGSSCTACRISLAVAEASRIRQEPPDALVACSHCDRLLVR